MNFRFLKILGITICSWPSFSLFSLTLTVNQNTDTLPAGNYVSDVNTDLRGALNRMNLMPLTYTGVNFNVGASNTITLGGMLPLLNLYSAGAISIDGANGGTQIVIDGGGAWRGFFVRQGQLTLQNMTIQNVTARGGTGGGGGMGAGAALFVDSANVILSNVTMNTATVIGGSGGPAPGSVTGGGGLGIGSTGSNGSANVPGGGGGFGGNGGIGTTTGNAQGSGGGGGINCGGGSQNGAGGSGGFTTGFAGTNGGATGSGATAAGAGGAGTTGSGGAGGLAGGGGGGGGGGYVGGTGDEEGTAAGGGGGLGGSPGDQINGGAGGYGGGGGGVSSRKSDLFPKGGDGGFGGGGGAGTTSFNTFHSGGNGGFGGGGGDAALFVPDPVCQGGFGGGGGAGNDFGADPPPGGVGGGRGGEDRGGGGGAGFGGAIFARAGSLTINGSFSTNGANSAAFGASGGGTASRGWNAGNDCFVLRGVTTLFDPQGSTITMTNSIADDSLGSFALAPAGITLPAAGAGAAITIGTNLGGTVIFSGANTYSGGTTINSGLLILSGSGALYSAGDVTINNNAFSAIFDISGISASSTQIGNLIGIAGATVRLGSRNLVLGTAASSTYAGVIQNQPALTPGTGGGVTKEGAGTFTLSGLNLYTGPTTVNGGVLQAGVINAFPSNSTVTMADIAGATLALNNFSQTIPSLAGGGAVGGNVTLGSATLTLTGNLNTTYSGSISGTGSLIKTGVAVFTLARTNSYTGSTSVNQGVLQAGATNAFSSGSAVTLADVAGVVLDLNGFSQTISSLSGGGMTGGNVTLGAGTLTTGAGGSTTYSGLISGGGGLNKVGATTFILTRATSYTGNTTVSAGVLRAGETNLFLSNSSVTMSNTAGATLDCNGFNQTIAALSGGGGSGGNITLGGANLTIDGSVSTIYSGSISGAGNLIKAGSSTVILGGSNSYGGSTTVNQGVLQLAVSETLPFGTPIIMADVAGATLSLNNFITQSIGSLTGGGALGGNVTLGAGTLRTGFGGSTTYSGSISGAGTLAKLGATTFTLAGMNSMGIISLSSGVLQAGITGAFSGDVDIESGGTLDLNGFSQTILSLSGSGNITLGAGTLTVNFAGLSIYSGSISGAGGLIKTGVGTFRLDNSNSYTGGTTINNGILRTGINGALGSGAISINNPAILDLTETLTLTNPISLGSIGIITVATSKTVTLNGLISGDSLFKGNPGTLTPTNSLNSYSGGTSIVGGTISVSNSGVLGTGEITIGPSGTLAGPGIFTLTNSVSLTITAGGIITVPAAQNMTISGVVSGELLTKTDAGILTLTNSFNTFNRATISAGTLSINAPFGSGNVSINTGATLIGNGTFTLANQFSLSSNSSIDVTGTNNMTLSRALGGAIFTKKGTGTLTLSNPGPNTSLGVNIQAGTVSIGGSFFQNSIITISPSATLQATGTFSLPVAVRYTLTPGVGIVDVTGTNNMTLLGRVSGLGGLIKINTGTLTLSNAISFYVGGTTITGGTVSTNVAAGLGTGGISIGALGTLQGTATFTLANPINLLAGSTVNVTASNDMTLSGTLAGIGGSLTKTGAGILTLSNTSNTYTGATTVNEGTLQAGDINAFSPNSAVSMANMAGATLALNDFSQTIPSLAGGGGTGGNVTLGTATLTLDGNLNTTYSGSIGGGGDLIKTGAATFIMEGTNSYTGGTTVSSGILQGNTSSLQGAITNNASVAFNQATNGTYSGNMTGSGSLTKENVGRVELTGINIYSGTTDIVGGDLAVNGPLTSGTVTVGSNGTLSGNSTITGNVINNGTVSPGNSIDTMFIVGNYTQVSGSTLLIEVSPSIADLLSISGTATIQNNTTLQISPLPGIYPTTASYLILSSTGLTGTFTNTPNNLPTIKFEVQYIGNDIFLDLSVLSFTTAACGGNIGKVAQYLDSLATPQEGSDLGSVIAILRFLHESQLDEALAQLQPAPYKNLILAQEENVFTVSRGISDHLNGLINPRCRKEVVRKECKSWEGILKNSLSGATNPPCQKEIDRKTHFEVWGAVFGDWASLNNRSSKHCKADEVLGYGAKGAGGMLGVDYFFRDYCVLGATGAYSYSNVHVNESRVKGHINSVYSAFYAMFQGAHLFLDAAILGGYDRFKAFRKIKFGTDDVGFIDRTAHTGHGGWSVDGHVDGGVIIDQWKVMEIRPFCALDCLFLHENAFLDRGAHSLDLQVRGSNNTLLRSEAGVHFARCFLVSYGSWTPQVRTSAVWETFGSNAETYRSNFVYQPGSFVVKNRNPNRVLFSPGAGVAGVFYDDQMSMLLDYFGEYGYGYHNQVIKAEFAWMF